ncbi:MAG: adenylate kinase [Actinomycetota bacterium]|nr:adenylate kinase [Actinomycetota bacterium]
MQRVVVLGRGGAGKSTAAARLGAILGLPVLELDNYFWKRDLAPTPLQEWVRMQQRLTAGTGWIMDGDLGPYDALGSRLAAADTVLVLDFSMMRCAWRAARRSRERADFWWWLVMWRHRSRLRVMDAIAQHAASADAYVIRTPRALRQFLAQLEGRGVARTGFSGSPSAEAPSDRL